MRMPSLTPSRAINDLQVLEAYRALILQRPPNLYQSTTVFSRIREHYSSNPELCGNFGAIDVVRSLLTPSGSPVMHANPYDSLCALTTLLVLAWHSVPARSMPPQANCSPTKPFFELGLNRWLQSQPERVDETVLILFHLGFVVLHTDMTSLHAIVRDFTLHKGKSPVISDAVTKWRASNDCDVAVLHAARLVELGKRVTSKVRHGISSQKANAKIPRASGRSDEPPHVAICTYLAVITQWVAELATKPGNLDRAKSIIGTGRNILTRSNLRIATVLGNILRCLDETGN